MQVLKQLPLNFPEPAQTPSPDRRGKAAAAPALHIPQEPTPAWGSQTTKNRLACRESQNKGDAVIKTTLSPLVTRNFGRSEPSPAPAPAGPPHGRAEPLASHPRRLRGYRGCSLPLASAFRGASIPRMAPGAPCEAAGLEARSSGCRESHPRDAGAGQRPGGHHSPGKTCPSALGKSCRKKTIAATPVILPRSSPALRAAAEPLPARRYAPHWWPCAAAAPAAGAAALLGAGSAAGRAGGRCPPSRAQRRPRPRRAGPAAPPGEPLAAKRSAGPGVLGAYGRPADRPHSAPR